MQFQSDLCGKRVLAARNEAASVTGAAYMAGIAAGLYDEGSLFEKQEWAVYDAQRPKEEREKRIQRWKQAVGRALTFPSGLLECLHMEYWLARCHRAVCEKGHSEADRRYGTVVL